MKCNEIAKLFDLIRKTILPKQYPGQKCLLINQENGIHEHALKNPARKEEF